MKIDDVLIHEEENLFISSPCSNVSEEDSLLHEEAMNLWEMANLHPGDTGLENMVVWVGGGGDRLKHGPRIKVVKGKKFKPELSSTVPLFGKPKIIGNANLTQSEFANLVAWIQLNRDVILKYWDDSISTREMLSMIKKF